MKIAGIEKLSLVDFDGVVSATIFTLGCNYKCGFCHNSPLVLSTNQTPTLNEEEILTYLKKRKGILEGLCITGGEPTLQHDLSSFCEKVKSLGYKTKLDTNGTNPDKVKELWNNGLIDYFAMDIKNDKENYAKIIGFDCYDLSKVEKTVEFFISNNVDYEFRTTLINEYHKKENIENIGKWIKGAKKYFLQKFKSTDGCINASSLTPVKDETVKEFIEILNKYLPTVKARGYDF